MWGNVGLFFKNEPLVLQAALRSERTIMAENGKSKGENYQVSFTVDKGHVYAKVGKQHEVLILSGNLECISGGGLEGKGSQKNKYRFLNRQEAQCEVEIPLEDFSKHPSDFLKPFFSHGLNVNYKQMGLAAEYIKSLKPQSFEVRAVSTGWRIEDGKASFVLPNKTLGDSTLVYGGEIPELCSQSGCTSSEWFAAMREPLIKSDFLLFSLGVAFSGPLVSIIDKDLITIFQIAGVSSSGKSTCGTLAASIYGPPKNFSESWRGTNNGFEGAFIQRNDLFINMDEAGAGSAKILKTAAYQMSSGTSKTTMTKDRKAREKLYWSLTALSSGELTIEEICARVGETIDAGALGRAPYLRTPDAETGVFNRATDALVSRKLAEFVNDFAKNNYGLLGEQWLSYLVESFDRIGREGRDFVTNLSTTWSRGLSSQAARASKRFALVAFALREAASCFELDCLPNTDAICKQFFEAWVSELNLGENLETSKVLDGLQNYLGANMARFAEHNKSVNGDWHVPHNCIGAKKDGKHFLYASELLEACPVNRKTAIDVLLKHKIISDTKGRTMNISGARVKVYELDLSYYEKGELPGYGVTKDRDEQKRTELDSKVTGNRSNPQNSQEEESGPESHKVESVIRLNKNTGTTYVSTGACPHCGNRHRGQACDGSSLGGAA